MPIPGPSKGESRDDYIGKCMHALKDEKRPQEQKLAICFSTWKRAKQHKKSSGSIEEPQWKDQVFRNEDGDCVILI